MTNPQDKELSSEQTSAWMNDMQERLIAQSAEIASEGHCGWGNTMAEAACLLKQIQIELATSPQLPVAEQPAGQAATHNNGWPEHCPITRREFFMMIDGVATYGGPFDSYTIPHMEGEAHEPFHERELSVRRYDHDRGEWVDDESIPLRVIHEDVLFDLQDKAEQVAAAPLSPVVQMSDDDACHNTHCNRGEYEGSCKYGEAETCPALASHPSNAVQDAPVAWMRKTDITEWTDSEPETDGWTPLCEQPAATVPQVVQAPSDEQIIAALEAEGLQCRSSYMTSIGIEQYVTKSAKQTIAAFRALLTTASNAGEAAQGDSQ